MSVVTYQVSGRKMHEQLLEGENVTQRAVEVLLTPVNVKNPRDFQPIVIQLTGPDCAKASEFVIGSRYELRKVEPALPELEKKVEVSP